MDQRYAYILYRSRNIKITNGHIKKSTSLANNSKSKQWFTIRSSKKKIIIFNADGGIVRLTFLLIEIQAEQPFEMQLDST